MYSPEAIEQVLLGDASSEGSTSTSFPRATDLFVPLQVVPRAPEHSGVTPTPTNHVTILYMSPTGLRSVHVSWEPTLNVQRLFARARLQDSIFKHIPVFKYARVIGRRRVKLSHYLRPGDILELNSSDRPFR
jgi:hypothetical protein